MKRIIICFLILSANLVHAQDLAFTRKMLDTLTSTTFWGRGYTNNGMLRAGDFLEKQLKTFGLQPMDGIKFKQDFEFPVNTFPGKMDVTINGKKLIPGVDFIVNEASMGQKSEGQLSKRDSTTYVDGAHRIIVVLKDKLTWSVAREVTDFTQITVNKKAVTGDPEQIAIDIENKFEPHFKPANICGIIKGTKNPDSLIILTAHYDHLGGMGKDTYFPGANDNASGVSFLLSMARYYAKNPQPYSIGFILFGAEEAGLIGSKYFSEHPLTDLKKIRFLINLDLVGTGEAGMTVVNATVYPKEFALLNQINDKDKLMVKINSRGKAANSDHYWFTEKGVPAFFIYTQGGITAYHDVFDKAATLPFTEYNDLFRLVDTFIRDLK